LNSIEAYVDCIAGASQKSDYLKAINSAGFKDTKIVDETIFPTGSLENDPTVAAVVEEAQITTAQAKKLASSIISIKVSAAKR
jgi:hypothetical protein